MNKRFLRIVLAIGVGLVAYAFFVFFIQTPNLTPAGSGIALGNPQSSDSQPSLDTPSTTTPSSSGTGTTPTPSRPATSTTATSSPATLADERFVVPFGSTSTDVVADKLLAEGFIANKIAFSLAFSARGGGMIQPGGYKLSKKMSAFEVAGVLHAAPYMKWVQIPEGLRKEEIADILARQLGWTAVQKTAWITTYTNTRPDYIEGVYFPDTYLIPVDETPAAVAQRLIAKFNEKFNPLLPQFNAQNIKWSTGLTLASIVQREAAGKSDMPLIAGILWNRLNTNMYLGVDATLQYARGNIGTGWWAPIKASDKSISSPFNTYTNKGLPPHAISNPGLSAIEATLHPATTDCLYYLHDNNGQIHCAATYEEHQANIQKYLVGTTTPPTSTTTAATSSTTAATSTATTSQ